MIWHIVFREVCKVLTILVFAAVCCRATNFERLRGIVEWLCEQFPKGFGHFSWKIESKEYNFYAEDNYKIFRNLTLNIGYRYEYVSAPKEVQNRIQYGYGADKDNHEPPSWLGICLDFEGGILGTLLGKSGDSSFRMGYGIYHGRIFQSVLLKPVQVLDSTLQMPRRIHCCNY